MYQLHVALTGSAPLIWRRLLVSGAARLATLHRVLQPVMGWNNTHPYEFDLGVGRYGESGLDVPERPRLKHAGRVTLESALGQLESFDYFYGAGQGWQHRLQVEALLPPDAGLRVARCGRASTPARQGAAAALTTIRRCCRSSPTRTTRSMCRNWRPWAGASNPGISIWHRSTACWRACASKACAPDRGMR